MSEEKAVSDILADCKSYSGNTFSNPRQPFAIDEPQRQYGYIKELSLNNVGFLQQCTNGKNGNLSWESVSRPYSSEGHHSSALNLSLRSETFRPYFPR